MDETRAERHALSNAIEKLEMIAAGRERSLWNDEAQALLAELAGCRAAIAWVLLHGTVGKQSERRLRAALASPPGPPEHTPENA